MAPDRIGFDWSSHKAALWWLGVLYRKPRLFQMAMETATHVGSIRAGVVIYLHALPYILALTVLCRLAFRPTRPGLELHQAMPIGILCGILFGAWLGTGAAVALAVTLGFSSSVVAGSGVSPVIVMAFSGILSSTATELRIANLVIAAGIVGFHRVIASALGIDNALAFWYTSLGCAMVIVQSRAYYAIASIPFVWPKPRPEWYRRHPVAWDDLCGTPFWRLDRLLVALAERDPRAGWTEIRRLIDTYPTQRDPALVAALTLLVRRAADAKLSEIDAAFADLPGGEDAVRAEIRSVLDRIKKIAASQRHLETVARLVMRQPLTKRLLDDIRACGDEAGRLREPLRAEFRRAASEWEKAARRQIDETGAAIGVMVAPQVFRSDGPVHRDREAFVTRDPIIAELARLALLPGGCPGVVLHGPRRGKSSLLHDLASAMPPNVEAAVVSLRDPDISQSVKSVCREISRQVQCVALYEEALAKCLDGGNHALADRNRRLVLAIDDYGALPTELLGVIADSIRKHRHIAWVFAGPVFTDRFPGAHILEVPCFTLAETRQLLTDPVRHSTLWPADSAERPRVAESFWGPGGIERIHAETAGEPYRVQSVAAACVDLLNRGGREVSLELLGRVLAQFA